MEQSGALFAAFAITKSAKHKSWCSPAALPCVFFIFPRCPPPVVGAGEPDFYFLLERQGGC